MLLTTAVAAGTGGAAFVKAFDEAGDIIMNESVAIPHVNGLNAWAAMRLLQREKRVELRSSMFGDLPIVNGINGVAHDLKRTGWCLSVDVVSPNGGGVTRKANIGVTEVELHAGDTLLWQLLEMRNFPARSEPNRPAADEAATAAAEGRSDDL